MFQDDFNEEKSEDPKDGRECKKVRIRSVDFAKVETKGQWLTHSPFEMEVREKLAGVPSASDLLVQEDDRVRRLIGVRTKMSMLIRRSNLTDREREYYRLIYVDGLTVSEVAQAMRVRVGTVRWVKNMIAQKLGAALEKRNLARRLGKLLKKLGTEQERTIWHLHYRMGLPVKELAEHLGLPERTVYLQLNNLLEKVSPKT